MADENFERERILAERLCTGDEDAFSEIYKLYAPSLIGFASSKLYSLEEATDLVQDVFVFLWSQRGTITIHTSLRSYLFGIIRHKIIDHIRKNATREVYASMIQSLAKALEDNIEKNLVAKDLGDYIEKVVTGMPPRTKEIYRLSRNEHKTISEISEMLHISPQTVKNQLTTALKTVKETLTRLAVFFLM